MLIVMENSTLEVMLSQTLQTENKQIKIAVTFLTGYTGIFNVTTKKIKIHFTVSFFEGDFTKISIPPGA